ncbi:MAG TPA: RICIN domain-containing protein [Kineosporiaceae bacterium]|nr:RICIN domain-containing protein [Kineosporiaceae bacterium]
MRHHPPGTRSLPPSTSAPKRFRKRAVAVLAASAVAVGVGAAWTQAQAASLAEVTSFGANPAGMRLYVYAPDRLPAHPKILVLLHGCGSTAPQNFGSYGREFVTAADTNGYVVIMPDNTRSGSCYDVSTPAALTRDGGSDPTSIASMIRYAQQRWSSRPADTAMVGFSSGAMTTNLMAAEYPDLFSAGAAFMGVPATCFATGSNSLWNSTCSGGKDVRTAQQWAAAARTVYPGYTGAFPRMQLWHGTTDPTLAYPNLGEEIKQWTQLHGLSQTPTSADSPRPAWTRTRYGSSGPTAPVEAISLSGAGHVMPLPGMAAFAVTFLGLDRPASTPGPTTPGPTTPAPTTPKPTTPAATTGSPGVDPTAWYGLVNRSTGKAADDYHWQTAEGAAVVQWPANRAAVQQWKFTATADGYYTIKNRNSGKVLEISGGSTADGTRVVQTTDAGRPSQQWKLTTDPGGYVHLVNRASGKALESSYQVITVGSPLDQYPYWGGTNQQWSLTR